MALTRNKPRLYSHLVRGNNLPLASTTTVYEGSAIGIDASTGRARALVAGDLFAGFASGRASSVADVVGAAPSAVALHVEGEVQLAVSGVTGTSLGASVFASDDDTFALTGTSLIGEVLRVPVAGQAVVGFIGGRSRMSSFQIYGLTTDAATTTWANRAAVVALGLTRAFFTDVGIGGSYWDYLGGRWRPQARVVTLKNLTSSVTQTTSTRAVMDFCTLPAGLWQDGDILECRFYKAMTTGTDTDTTESAIGTGSGTFGTSLGLSTAALTNTNPVLSAAWRWRRVSNSIIRHAGIGGSTGLGSAGSLLNDITASVPDMDNVTTYPQLSGVLTTGAGAVSALRACTWTLICGA